MNLVFEKLNPGDSKNIARMSALAKPIVKEHFDPLIGPAQNDYMIAMFQSEESIAGQLENGYQYFFVRLENEPAEGNDIGFVAYYEDGPEVHLSKFYLKKENRGQGVARKMNEFVIQAAKDLGYHRVALNVNRGNSAVTAYKYLGYFIDHEEVNDIGQGFVMDDYVMAIEF